MHNGLPRGELSKALSRVVGDMEGSDGLERYGETLQPTIDLWRSPEFAWLRREFLLVNQATAGPVPAEYGALALVNPAASGMIVVVERVYFWLAAQGAASLQRVVEATVAGTLAAGGRGISRDTRNPLTLPGAALIYAGTDPGGIGTTLERVWTPSGANNTGYYSVSLPYVLSPGQALVSQAGVPNVAFETGFCYRERRANRGELE